MAKITLPFSMDNKVDNHEMGLLSCDLYKVLPQPLQKIVESNLSLLDYLHMVPLAQVGLPQYYTELTRKMGDTKKPNLIYPVSNDVYVHILVDDKDSRNNYIPVEPTLTLDLDLLIPEVERKCVALSEDLVEFDPEGDMKEQLLHYLDQVVTAKDEPGARLFPDPYEGPLHRGTKLNKIRVTERELDAIRYAFIRDKIGLGNLEPLIMDPYIEDISCSGLGHVFIEHKIFKSLKSTIVFPSMQDLDEFVLRLSERVKKPVTYKEPIADATLPDGSRINIVFGRDLSKRGSNFTIRKFSDTPISIFELVDFGTLNYQILAYLSLVISNEMNVFVCGESASGKTALLNAITTFIHPLAKVISIEDTPELQVPHPNWIREVVQSTKTDDDTGAVTMFDLLKAALRQRPNEILVGEIRGPEGNIAFQAMQTGHSVMATLHAATVQKLIQRITSNPISVPRPYIDNLNVVILMSVVKLPNGTQGRRITGISEIVGYDSASETFNIMESFHWDEATDTFEFTGNMTSYILEYKIATKLGIPTNEKRRIYAELGRRAKILEKLHKEQGITGFYEILDVLGKAQREGLF
ncbi:MAG TPA: type II/IV secretion system ATPase subunit [Dehalococcoidia bacterium]|nr:type II/IV secretion system ATPase subunit [Dehalococcoidia bacterium]